MPKIRVATFNVENLFARFKFNDKIDPNRAVQDGWKAEDQYFTIADDENKHITAEVILKLNPDILALQEVENLDTLKRFRKNYLGGRKAYPFAISIDGNDSRLIDVAILSRYEIVHLRSYQHLSAPDRPAPLFTRDCLEADILINGVRLTLFVNHFKSMAFGADICNGRSRTRIVREHQARAVMKIITDRFGQNSGQERFIVLGDFNDYLATDDQGTTGVGDLVRWDQVENVVERLPEDERWTHHFKGDPICNIPEAYQQLDYMLLSRSLADMNSNLPIIERSGMPLRATRYEGPRIEGVGQDFPKASDHCPVAIDLDL